MSRNANVKVVLRSAMLALSGFQAEERKARAADVRTPDCREALHRSRHEVVNRALVEDSRWRLHSSARQHFADCGTGVAAAKDMRRILFQIEEGNST
jgi:hypothetical protein